MSMTLLSGPAEEPVGLADLKAYLRVDDAVEDGLIASLGQAARTHLEALSGRAFVTQTWRVTRDRWPAAGRLSLPIAPVASLAAVRVAAGGTMTSLTLDRFRLDGAGAPPVLAWGPAAVPAPDVDLGGIAIDLVCGYGAASAVPAPLVHAIRLLVAHWFENRGIIAVGHEVAATPRAVEALIAPYVVRRL